MFVSPVRRPFVCASVSDRLAGHASFADAEGRSCGLAVMPAGRGKTNGGCCRDGVGHSGVLCSPQWLR